MNYYNEFDPNAAEWLRELIRDGLIPEGVVDERDIREVRPEELTDFTQWHFFAGIGGWPIALRLAGWSDQWPVLTGSCPCPPFSAAGKKKTCPECQGREVIPHPYQTGIFACVGCGHEWLADGRHLWPELWRIIRGLRPAVAMGEQVAGADGVVWFSGVRVTLEHIGYTSWGADLAAASVGAPHIRQRLFWLADSTGKRFQRRKEQDSRSQQSEQYAQGRNDFGGYCRHDPGRLVSPSLPGCKGCGLHGCRCASQHPPRTTGDDAGGIYDAWRHSVPILCRDGKHRRVPTVDAESGFLGLVDGLSAGVGDGGTAGDGGGEISQTLYPLSPSQAGRVGLLKGFGNAIVPQVAAEFIRTYMESE